MLRKYVCPLCLLWGKYRFFRSRRIVSMVLFAMLAVACVGWVLMTLQTQTLGIAPERAAVITNPDVAVAPPVTVVVPPALPDRMPAVVTGKKVEDTPPSTPSGGNGQVVNWHSPVAGQLARAYGWQYMVLYDDWRFFPGITIQTGERATVTSVCRGVVSSVEKVHDTYVVAVTRGEVRVVYADLAAAVVADGREVALGDAIGTTGQTAEQPYAHLNVFIYENGEAVNPLSRFAFPG